MAQLSLAAHYVKNVYEGIRTEKELFTHPKIGASWEGYAVEEALSQLEPDQAYFWATYQGAELDLLLFKNGRRLGVEIKRADAPALTPSIRSALADLKLDQLIVLYPGSQAYDLEPNQCAGRCDRRNSVSQEEASDTHGVSVVIATAGQKRNGSSSVSGCSGAQLSDSALDDAPGGEAIADSMSAQPSI